ELGAAPHDVEESPVERRIVEGVHRSLGRWERDDVALELADGIREAYEDDVERAGPEPDAVAAHHATAKPRLAPEPALLCDPVHAGAPEMSPLDVRHIAVSSIP